MQPLLILGVSARAAAFSARRAGLAPHAIDAFADRDLAACCPAVRVDYEPRAFLAAAAQFPAMPWMYAGGLENHPHVVAELAAARPLWGNGGAALRSARDLRQVAAALAPLGVRVPETRAELPLPQAGRWLRKPLASGGGLGIAEALSPCASRPGAGHVFQRYEPGTPASAAFVAARGEAVLLGTTRQLIGPAWQAPGPFQYAGNIAPLAMDEATRALLARVGQAVARAGALTGLFGVDFVLGPAGPVIVEVNPRYTAALEILEELYGLATLDFHAAACRDGALPAPPALKLSPASATGRCVGKLVVYAAEACRVEERLPALVDAWNSCSAWPSAADLPALGAEIPAGGPVLTVFSRGTDERGVEEELRRRAAEVRAALRRGD